LRLARHGSELRREMLEHVQLRVQRLRGIQIESVPAPPAESPSRRALQAIEVDATPAQEVEVLERKVLADDADHRDPGEQARGGGEVGSTSAQHVLALAERRLHRIERDAAHHQEAHALNLSPRSKAGRSRAAGGIWAGAVITELSSARAQAQTRSPRRPSRARRRGPPRAPGPRSWAVS